MPPADNGRRVDLNAREIVDIVTDAYSAERGAIVKYLWRRARAADPSAAGALRAAAEDIEAGMHREGK